MMNPNKTRTVNDVPMNWDWFFEMSLLETMQIKFAGELVVDFDFNSAHICVLSYATFSTTNRELVPIVYHGKAKNK